MSGEFITKTNADTIIAAAATPSAFVIDTPNLMEYIQTSSADQIRIDAGKNADGSPTIVVTCLKAGRPVYVQIGGDSYVLEHITPAPTS